MSESNLSNHDPDRDLNEANLCSENIADKSSFSDEDQDLELTDDGLDDVAGGTEPTGGSRITGGS